MSIKDKIKTKGIFGILAALGTRLHMLKTIAWYRLFFRSIGSHSVIRNPLLIVNPKCISIGGNVSIRDGARLEALPREGEAKPEIWIGNNVNIEQDFHLACCGKIWIGDNTSIAARCAVVDITHPFWKVDESKSLAGEILGGTQFVKIGRRVFLGIGVTVLPNVEIGEGAVVGAHSVVTGNLPPFCIAIGAPAKVVRYWR